MAWGKGLFFNKQEGSIWKQKASYIQMEKKSLNSR